MGNIKNILAIRIVALLSMLYLSSCQEENKEENSNKENPTVTDNKEIYPDDSLENTSSTAFNESTKDGGNYKDTISVSLELFKSYYASLTDLDSFHMTVNYNGKNSKVIAYQYYKDIAALETRTKTDSGILKRDYFIGNTEYMFKIEKPNGSVRTGIIRPERTLEDYTEEHEFFFAEAKKKASIKKEEIATKRDLKFTDKCMWETSKIFEAIYPHLPSYKQLEKYGWQVSIQDTFTFESNPFNVKRVFSMSDDSNSVFFYVTFDNDTVTSGISLVSTASVFNRAFPYNSSYTKLMTLLGTRMPNNCSNLTILNPKEKFEYIELTYNKGRLKRFNFRKVLADV